MTEFVAETAGAVRIQRARRGAAWCREAIAEVVEARRVVVDESTLTRSELILLRARKRAAEQRRTAA